MGNKRTANEILNLELDEAVTDMVEKWANDLSEDAKIRMSAWDFFVLLAGVQNLIDKSKAPTND